VGYICMVDKEHHDGAPVKVVMEQRPVEYEHDNGISTGFETVREVFVHPDNVDILGPARMSDKIKTVNIRTKKESDRFQRKDRNQAKEGTMSEALSKTWREYQNSGK